MTGFLTKIRWSTLTLLSVGVAFFYLGHRAAHPDAAPASSSSRAAPLAAAFSTDPVSRPMPDEKPLDRWRELFSSVRTPVLEKNLLALIADIAAADPARALALATAESNWRLRTLLRDAALRGWATTAPAAAADYALALPESERRAAVAALFLGASNQPETAAAIATRLCAQDTALADDHGRALIAALAEVGAFSVAAQFAAADTTGHGADWLGAAFGQWAERQPAAALAALDTLVPSAARAAAFQGLVLGWSMADPRELAAYAASLPAGGNRSLAMQQALSQWLPHDAEGVKQWVQRFDPGPEFDLSVATLATAPKLAMQQPAVALGWAQSILEPALRESTLTALARDWADHDRAGARRLIEQTTDLSPEDRRVLLAGLEAPPPDE